MRVIVTLSFCADGVVEKVLVGEADAFFKFGVVGPAESSSLGNVEEFARSAVGTGGIPFDLTLVADNFGN